MTIVARRARTLVTRPLPLHPLLLAAYAVLFLYASNLSEADIGQVVPVLVTVVFGVGILLVAGTFVLGDAARAAILLSAAVALFFGYRHVQIVTADLPVSGRVVQVAWVILGAGALVLAWRGRRQLLTATRALNAIALALVLVSLVSIVPHEVEVLSRARANAATAGPTAQSSDDVERRDIWFLVFDRYGSAESLRLNYDIEDELTPWLAERGFHVTPDAHDNYPNTRLSLASALNLDYLDALAGRTIPELLADHEAGRFLTGVGYRYIHVGSRFQPTRSSPLATVNLALDNASDFATALFDSSLAPTIVGRVQELDPRRQRQADWANFAFEALEDTIHEPGPKFVFAHMLVPHSPYVFDADGRLVSEEEDAGRSIADAYEAQLRYVDGRIKALVERLLALPESERPIVVLTADEGPYPKNIEGNPVIGGPDVDYDWSTVSDDELRIKYGILHAMLLPDGEGVRVPQSLTAVNTFRFLFSAYLGADMPLLPNRILVPNPERDGYVDEGPRIGVTP
jgi:hypothetical protein